MDLPFLLLTILLEAFSQVTNGDPNLPTDMDGKAFLYPEESITNYVILKPNLPNPLKSFTLCLGAKSDLTRKYTLFSGSNKDQFNDVLLLNSAQEEYPYIVHVGGEIINFKTSENNFARKHTCATWDSSDGIVQLWINGNPSVRKVLKQGYNIPADLIVILGQEQDSYGGNFEIQQSFRGEIDSVHMWNHVLSNTEIQQVMANNKAFNGNVINWRDLRYEIKGNIRVVPSDETIN